MGCFRRRRRSAQVRQVFALRGAVGDCESHFGYDQEYVHRSETLNSRRRMEGSALRSSRRVPWDSSRSSSESRFVCPRTCSNCKVSRRSRVTLTRSVWTTSGCPDCGVRRGRKCSCTAWCFFNVGRVCLFRFASRNNFPFYEKVSFRGD